MVTKEWVAVHRKHHAKCETAEDPHSPQVKGLRKILLEGAELYQEEASHKETLEHYGHGTPDDWLERHLYSAYSGLGITLMAAIDFVLFGVYGVTIWAVQMLWIPFWAAGIINGAGHYWGYRNYETADDSTNLSPVGILIGGEELHNNHHAFPGSAKFSLKAWEFDIGWLYLRIFQMLGLVKIKKVAPKPVAGPIKERIDLETARAIVTGRLYVIAQYGRQVILPILREEELKTDPKSRQELKRGKKALLRESLRLDERARNRLTVALQTSETLKTAYECREQLKSLWNRRQSTETLLDSLQEWCNRAEASGIQSLQQFSRNMRGYHLSSDSGSV